MNENLLFFLQLAPPCVNATACARDIRYRYEYIPVVRDSNSFFFTTLSRAFFFFLFLLDSFFTFFFHNAEECIIILFLKENSTRAAGRARAQLKSSPIQSGTYARAADTNCVCCVCGGAAVDDENKFLTSFLAEWGDDTGKEKREMIRWEEAVCAARPRLLGNVEWGFRFFYLSGRRGKKHTTTSEICLL